LRMTSIPIVVGDLQHQPKLVLREKYTLRAFNRKAHGERLISNVERRSRHRHPDKKSATAQLFFDVTAKKAVASWWTCLAPQSGQAISPFSYSARVRMTSKGFWQSSQKNS